MLLPRLAKTISMAAVYVQPVAADAQETTQKDAEPKQVESKSGQWCRPSDLPIYPTKKPPPRPPQLKEPQDSELHQNLERGIRQFRCQAQHTCDTMLQRAGVLTEPYDAAKKELQRTIDYLNEPQNTFQRCAAIALGGLVGFICAFRGGIIKKTIYTSIGAGAVASVCYPRAAEEQARNAYFECRKTVTIAYNYLRGVKTGEEVLEPINKFPSTIEDFKHLAADIYYGGKEVLFSKKKNS